MVASKEACCSQRSRTSVLKDVTFLACSESWWEFGLIKARSSGVIVYAELRLKPHHLSKTRLSGSASCLTDPLAALPRESFMGCETLPKKLVLGWDWERRAKLEFFSRGERGLCTFENHRWLFRAARDLLFLHCVSGGLSAHPHATFLSYNKQKNTKHVSESHMFILS